MNVKFVPGIKREEITDLINEFRNMVANLEAENADLWYADMLKSAFISEHDREIADIWYVMMTGGANV